MGVCHQTTWFLHPFQVSLRQQAGMYKIELEMSILKWGFRKSGASEKRKIQSFAQWILHLSRPSRSNQVLTRQVRARQGRDLFAHQGMSEEIRYRPKGVFGKGVGNSQNASEMRQKCVKNASEMRQNGSCFIGKRGTFKMRQKSVKIASKMRQKCAEHLWGRTPFGRYREILRKEI